MHGAGVVFYPAKPRCSVCGERAEKQVTPPMPKFEGYLRNVDLDDSKFLIQLRSETQEFWRFGLCREFKRASLTKGTCGS